MTKAHEKNLIYPLFSFIDYANPLFMFIPFFFSSENLHIIF